VTDDTVSVSATIGLVSAKLSDGSDPDFLQFCGLQTDLIPTSLTRDDQGGVDFAYDVSVAPLTKGTSVALYWSADDNFDPGVDSPTGYSVAAQRAVGSYKL
jgi:hypothetical protein